MAFADNSLIFCKMTRVVDGVELSICTGFVETTCTTYVVEVLRGQPIKLIQVASNSELHENQWKDLLFFEIVPSHCFGASEVQT